jgi:hypothetical protein
MNLSKLAFQIDSDDGSRQKAIYFMIFHGLAQSSINCKNGHECKLDYNKVSFRCRTKFYNLEGRRITCDFKQSVFKHTIFENSKMPANILIKVIYCWAYRLSQSQTIHECSLGSNHTCVDWFMMLRELCHVDMSKVKIGGPGRIVEIDESKYGKRKYN